MVNVFGKVAVSVYAKILAGSMTTLSEVSPWRHPSEHGGAIALITTLQQLESCRWHMLQAGSSCASATTSWNTCMHAAHARKL